MQLDNLDSQEMPAILVIDDDGTSLALICLMLEAEGYSVIRAAGGEEALRIAGELPEGGRPSIVLADLQMPGLCGRELALAMRSLLPDSTLVAMSATPTAVEVYDGFVSKPLDTAALRELIVHVDGDAAEADAFAGGDAAAPVLDERVFRKLQRMMPSASLADVYKTCLSDARKRASELVELAQAQEEWREPVRRCAHAIKGGAGMVGATRLAQAAARLEFGGYGREELPALVNKLLDSCDLLQGILVTKVNS